VENEFMSLATVCSLGLKNENIADESDSEASCERMNFLVSIFFVLVKVTVIFVATE
jgi:hypothetical protein